MSILKCRETWKFKNIGTNKLQIHSYDCGYSSASRDFVNQQLWTLCLLKYSLFYSLIFLPPSFFSSLFYRCT